jgi:alpha-ribazole phosphatase/probable phosphoglycerate mutase
MVFITNFVHCTTIDNEKGLATGWLPGELSELGRKQSIELGRIIKQKFDALFTSDLIRAVET